MRQAVVPFRATSELWDCWRVYVKPGLTTLPEMEENPRSDCHAWASGTLADFPSTILGKVKLDY
ncbi:hypothetical protein [Litchfieldia alkalitelluris]|uniref:hypothetical protein n=1 Tax=Litchfieldia alkalitelluris TaxID=304268 RepID=UPI000998D685|nr:hypothetical protein [Litchfieldia alkalitelluris]